MRPVGGRKLQDNGTQNELRPWLRPVFDAALVSAAPTPVLRFEVLRRWVRRAPCGRQRCAFAAQREWQPERHQQHDRCGPGTAHGGIIAPSQETFNLSLLAAPHSRIRVRSTLLQNLWVAETSSACAISFAGVCRGRLLQRLVVVSNYLNELQRETGCPILRGKGRAVKTDGLQVERETGKRRAVGPRLPQLPRYLDHAGACRRRPARTGSARHGPPDRRGRHEAPLSPRPGRFPAGHPQGTSGAWAASGRSIPEHQAINQRP